MRGMTLYTFRYTVRHDSGVFQAITTGISPQAARHKVMLAEGCPLRAIVKEEIKDGNRFVLFMGR